MIIKKPYAFLIKNFRVLHAIIFLMLGYIAIKTINIYSFYNSYARNDYYINSANLASDYINYFLFIAIIILILFSLVVYYILKIKNKETRFYISICIYYIILFIFFIIILNFFQELQYKSLEYETIRIIRDFSLIALLPQIVFCFIALGRALGFNIKQFDFKKDLEELQIEASDYEEVEITFGKNNYKYKRALRKTLRHIKYFMLENKFFVTIIGSVTVLIITLVVFVNLRVYNVNYSQQEQILANTLWYTAEDAYITNKDISGNEINKGKYYLLIRMNINNRISSGATLDRNTFRVKIGDKIITPKFNLSNMFIDIGETFSPTTVESGTSKEYILVYELEEDEVQKEYILKIRNSDNISLGDIAAAYKDVIIRPYDLYSDNDAGTYTLPNDIDLKGTTLYNSYVHISSYEISKSFKEKYKYCEKDKCYDGIYTVNPEVTGKGENTILKLNSTISIDEALYMKNYFEYPSDLYTYFASVTYRTEGEYKTVKLKAINTKYNKDNTSYFEVPKNIENANKIELVLDIRGVRYTVILK